MPSDYQIQVLHGFRPCVRLLKVFNLDNFSNNQPCIIRQNLLHATGIFLLFSSHFMSLVFNLTSCFNNELALDEIAFKLVVFLCETQQFLVFVSLTKTNRRIAGSIDRLQRAVENRNCCHFCCRKSIDSSSFDLRFVLMPFCFVHLSSLNRIELFVLHLWSCWTKIRYNCALLLQVYRVAADRFAFDLCVNARFVCVFRFSGAGSMVYAAWLPVSCPDVHYANVISYSCTLE